ncbi:MAG: GNAT family N-acetyltransferase [Clostridia bacterium]|nr:GNAT family N-acetyltransferase [Clostridia bacterium]
MNNVISGFDIYELDEKQIEKDCIKNIAKLHAEAFPHFFLTQLGTAFLETLYKGYIEDGNSGIIVAENDGNIVGFVAYSKEYSEFYKNLIKNHIVRFGICSAIAAIKHPLFIKRLFGAFNKSNSVKKQEPYVELASICVSPKAEHMGIGSALLGYLIEHTDFTKYEYINLETDAENNEAVNRFYIKNGFYLARQYMTPENRKMNEYRYGVKNENLVH